MTKPKEIKLTKEQRLIHHLSNRIVIAQRPIRILDAIKWGDDIKRKFFKFNFKKLPAINYEYYHRYALPFVPEKKIAEFRHIIHEITAKLGTSTEIGKIMIRICNEYIHAIELIKARGTKEFGVLSEELYGSPEDAFYPGGPKLKDLSNLLANILLGLKEKIITDFDIKKYTAKQTVRILQKRLRQYFGPESKVTVKIADNIVADASAGATSIKVNKDVLFSERDINALEVHEGWVHIGTTLNGMQQPICTFLSKGSPSTAITQEGLAVITEIFTFSSSPDRVLKLTNRLASINLVTEGANFIEIFNYFRDHGLNEDESYNNCVRVFRGSLPEGAGPFTKDLAYSKGFLLIYNFIRLAVKYGHLKHIPLLFCGKTIIDEIQILTDLADQGIITQPVYLPPQFRDLSALSAWMCYSLFLNKIELAKIEAFYRHF